MKNPRTPSPRNVSSTHWRAVTEFPPTELTCMRVLTVSKGCPVVSREGSAQVGRKTMALHISPTAVLADPLMKPAVTSTKESISAARRPASDVTRSQDEIWCLDPSLFTAQPVWVLQRHPTGRALNHRSHGAAGLGFCRPVDTPDPQLHYTPRSVSSSLCLSRSVRHGRGWGRSRRLGATAPRRSSPCGLGGAAAAVGAVATGGHKPGCLQLSQLIC